MSWGFLRFVIVVLPDHTHLLFFILRMLLGKYFVCGRVPWLNQYWPSGFMVFVVLCPGTTEGSTGSGSGFKASQKTDQRLKVSENISALYMLSIKICFQI